MSTVFVGDEGTLIKLSVGSDISDATITNILYSNSSATGEWVGSLGSDNTSVEYTLQSGDMAVIGRWALQAYVETPNGIWHGDIAYITVKNPVHS